MACKKHLQQRFSSEVHHHLMNRSLTVGLYISTYTITKQHDKESFVGNSQHGTHGVTLHSTPKRGELYVGHEPPECDVLTELGRRRGATQAPFLESPQPPNTNSSPTMQVLHREYSLMGVGVVPY